MAPDRPVVAMLLYPGLTNLDLVGPHAVWSWAMDVHLVWKDLDPVETDSGMKILPTTTLANCPADVDVLFVPGGAGTSDAIADPEVLDFLADRGSRARYVTSVCTGSLILAAAGLLRGYRAGTHWAFREHLAPMGAECVAERVVVDRNRVTGGGVTAGIDFGLTVLAELAGDDRARFAQLVLEYDPAPPFDAGAPEKADPATVEAVRSILTEDHATLRRIISGLA
ncbi:DJ-1/PfpI family protein [Actinokineospora pegani]|uniref:DJ-1/PfpI family protein n=1 Tax=Actinokineospora pegani TaxID=2654637 RepID=UPI0012EA28F2|nr:DJ-1/PfpI family protein [Actinokineospora pegani]